MRFTSLALADGINRKTLKNNKGDYMRILKVLMMLAVLVLMSACAKPKDGLAGKDGSRGEQGPPGNTGPAGIDGLPAKVVNLCPGVTSYPGVFVEVALCLNSRLYGVYSANGGFLTELIPGSYSSNAIGSACNLVVHDNCVVTY